MHDYNQLLTMDALALADFLDEMQVNVPSEIVSPDDMNNASRLLLKLSGYYSYLTALLSRAEIATREAKRKLSKEEYEDSVDRKKIISNATDRVKQQYAAISRAVTIHVENMQELRYCQG